MKMPLESENVKKFLLGIEGYLVSSKKYTA
jgi:hypothetical protein